MIEPQIIDAASANEMLQSGSAILIVDIRTVDEFERGNIASSIHLPWRMIDGLNTMGWDRAATYVVVGSDPAGTARAADALASLGFDAYILEHGMLGWIELGLPVHVRAARGKFCCGRGCGC